MTTSLHLCEPRDLPVLLGLAARYHDETGLDRDEAVREAALAPLLEGSPLGAVYLAGPRSAPIGYIVVGFGWSMAGGGMTGTVEELWVRPSVRGRGLGTEILMEVSKALEAAGLSSLQVEVPCDDEAAQRVFARARFALRDGHALMLRGA